MKRIFSLGLISAVLFSFASPLAAQRGRDVKTRNIKSSESANRFESVRAYSDGNGVLVEWQMSRETDNAGFSVFRLDGYETKVVSPSMILGSAAKYGSKAVSGERYSFFDTDGTPSSVYYVQNQAMDGKSGASVTAAVETVTDLTALGRGSSEELQQQLAERKQNGKVISEELNFPKALTQEVVANRPSADSSTHTWVVSQPGVRIGVRREGFYRVTKAELQSAGFNVNGDNSLWQLYREGVEQAILIGPNADYIDFFGKGVEVPETDMAMYYLVSGPSAGKRIATRIARPVAGTVTSRNYSQVSWFKQRTNYVHQILNGDAENYWGAVTFSSGTTSVNFTLSGVDFDSPESTVNISFQGFSVTGPQHSVTITLNGNSLAPATGATRTAFSKQYTIPTSYLREGTNTLVLRTNGITSPVNTDISLFDSISASFARKFVAGQNRLKFYTSNYRLSTLQGFSSANVRVFDITSETAPVLWTNSNIVQDGPTYSVRMPADRGRSMYAVENSGLQQAASITSNNPANLKVPTNAANLIIITHQNWMTEAQAWATYRQLQGITVKTVDVSEIYDEFSYGDLSSLAIKNFLQYARNNWQLAPTYVLLLGDSSFDSRNYQGLGYNNYVPTHIVNTVFLETASDDFLTDFNNDGLAEIAIGRIAARNGVTVTNALAKTTLWEQAIPTLQARGVLFAHDQFDANNNYDFEQISIRIKNELPGNVPTVLIGRDDTPPPPDTPQTLLVSSMNTGKYLVNFAGHGTTGAWASLAFFSNSNVPQLTNATNPSIYTMLTCLNGYFHHASDRSLAENLVEATNGGAVAAWASTGETTPDVQEAMAKQFYDQAGQGQILRLGDLVNDAKTVIPGGTDVRLSWALIGDPMLKLH